LKPIGYGDSLGFEEEGAEEEDITVRVLIVDDQKPFRAIARMVVELTDGFEVVGEAVTGEDSVVSARVLKPDLVLMDVNLPGINGLEATEQILAEPTPPVVLVLSTYEAEEYAPRAAGVGAAAYIPKSLFDPEALTGAWEAAGSGTRGADVGNSARNDT
jgi:DNA-binding NarL/FixJ family response regulator